MSRSVPASKKNVWMTLAAALALHTGLISLQGRKRIDTGFVRAWMLDIAGPVEKLADRCFYGVGYAWDSYVALVGVHHENDRLREENEQLRMKIVEQREAVLEAGRVRALAGLQEAGLGKSVLARVIASDPAGGETVTIDKGTVHGVRPDTAVATPEGIVGRVIHSSRYFSIVQLVTDQQSAVGVMVESDRRQGVVKGLGGPLLALDFIDDDSTLKEGDLFLTSGQDRVYPKGLPVGVIAAVGPRRGLLKTVSIRPSARLDRLENVLCIEQPQNRDPGQSDGELIP